jgi:eukaryotic-like serine/threonine-protein kinase
LPERVLGPGDVRRFLKEAQAAARLDHPHIVRVYDAGELGPFGYYIASEYCAGPNLRRWLKGQNEPVPGRLAASWLANLADAVQHAHDRGILHRDIKPDNVILTGASGPDEFIPRLTDFGLAKLLEEPGDETRSGARMGTPHYMAPEQAAGLKSEVGPATDVYGLGATLYELLTGRQAFRGENDVGTLRLVLEGEPVAPRTLRPGLPRDLETICLKCLRKVPARRYTAAAGLRADLERFLAGQPIEGRPPSTWERARALARRRPGYAALLALAVIVALATVGGVATWTSWLQWHNRLLEAEVARADRQTREAETQRQVAQERLLLAERHHRSESLRRAREALDARQTDLAQDILHDIEPQASSRLRDFAWHYLWRQANRELARLWIHEGPIATSTLSLDGSTLASRDTRGTLLIASLPTGVGEPARRRIQSPGCNSDSDVVWLSPDGRLVATLEDVPASPGLDVFDAGAGTHLARLDLKRGEAVGSLILDAVASRLAFVRNGPDGSRSLMIWRFSSSSGRADPLDRPLGGPGALAELSRDGRLLAVGRAGRILLQNPWTGEPRAQLEGEGLSPTAVATFSSDGSSFAAAFRGNQARLWETGSGRELARFSGGAEVAKLDLGPTGSKLAILDSAGQVSLVDRSTGKGMALFPDLPPRQARFHIASFSPNQRLLAFSYFADPGGPEPLQVWDVDSGRRCAIHPGRHNLQNVVFLPDGRRLVFSNDRLLSVWGLDPPTSPNTLTGHAAEAWAAAFSPDGKILATASDDTGERQTIKLWDPAAGKQLAGWKAHTATVSALAFSPDGNLLASTSLDAGAERNPNLILWDLATRRQVATLRGHTDRVRAVAFSPDGQTLASGGNDNSVRLWNVSRRNERAILTGHANKVGSLAFSPDGHALASAAIDGTVRIWDVATAMPLRILKDESPAARVAWAADGSRVASASEGGVIKLWDPVDGRLIRTIHGDAKEFRSLAFTPDSQSIAAAGKGQVIRFWDVATGQQVLSLEGHQAPVNALAFSPDGSMLASCSHDGAVRLWHASPIDPLAKP